MINAGEFEAVGTAAAGPRADKRARQHAALQVLQRLGYNVSFELPQQPGGGGGAPGGGGGYGRGGPGGGAPGGGGGGQRYGGRSLDARHARAAQGQQAVSRDAYLASLQDELS